MKKRVNLRAIILAGLTLAPSAWAAEEKKETFEKTIQNFKGEIEEKRVELKKIKPAWLPYALIEQDFLILASLFDQILTNISTPDQTEEIKKQRTKLVESIDTVIKNLGNAEKGFLGTGGTGKDTAWEKVKTLQFFNTTKTIDKYLEERWKKIKKYLTEEKMFTDEKVHKIIKTPRSLFLKFDLHGALEVHDKTETEKFLTDDIKNAYEEAQKNSTIQAIQKLKTELEEAITKKDLLNAREAGLALLEKQKNVWHTSAQGAPAALFGPLKDKIDEKIFELKEQIEKSVGKTAKDIEDENKKNIDGYTALLGGQIEMLKKLYEYKKQISSEFKNAGIENPEDKASKIIEAGTSPILNETDVEKLKNFENIKTTSGIAEQTKKILDEVKKLKDQKENEEKLKKEKEEQEKKAQLEKEEKEKKEKLEQEEQKKKEKEEELKKLKEKFEEEEKLKKKQEKQFSEAIIRIKKEIPVKTTNWINDVKTPLAWSLELAEKSTKIIESNAHKITEQITKLKTKTDVEKAFKDASDTYGAIIKNMITLLKKLETYKNNLANAFELAHIKNSSQAANRIATIGAEEILALDDFTGKMEVDKLTHYQTMEAEKGRLLGEQYLLDFYRALQSI